MTSITSIGKADLSWFQSLPLKKITCAVAVAVSVAGVASYITHSQKYSNSIVEDVDTRLTPQDERIKAALVTQVAQNIIDSSSLDKSKLAEIANNVNASFIHASGNCALLSGCMLYNLSHGREVLAAKNTFPIYEGVSSNTVQKALFGKPLTKLGSEIKGIENLEKRLLDYYERTAQRFYVIESGGYEVPILGACGHALNAVILLDKDKPYVQLVDAWKTSNYTPTGDELPTRYTKEGTFSILCLHTQTISNDVAPA